MHRQPPMALGAPADGWPCRGNSTRRPPPLLLRPDPSHMPRTGTEVAGPRQTDAVRTNHLHPPHTPVTPAAACWLRFHIPCGRQEEVPALKQTLRYHQTSRLHVRTPPRCPTDFGHTRLLVKRGEPHKVTDWSSYASLFL
uniref:Uncharacterized protein n=1 Tax=Molossus molossus TaxID=27622 RepID=A0A7J8JVU6_MOLMO|nr:hypothetical protein HJG59_008000 [Molossus molossus]